MVNFCLCLFVLSGFHGIIDFEKTITDLGNLVPSYITIGIILTTACFRLGLVLLLALRLVVVVVGGGSGCLRFLCLRLRLRLRLRLSLRLLFGLALARRRRCL